VNLAYLSIIEHPKGLRGGLLLIDQSGLPLDFLYTDPVTPTRIQRALYGPTLDFHLRTRVIGQTLLGELKQEFGLLVVSEPYLLTLGTPQHPAIILRRSDAQPLGGAGDLKEIRQSTYLVQTTDLGSPLEMEVREGTDRGAVEAIARTLTQLGALLDLVEPLERIERVMRLLDSEASGEARRDNG